MNENLTKLTIMLKAHDWSFEQSDDGRVYSRGRAERNEIFAERKRLIDQNLATPEEVQELFNQYQR